MDDIIAIQKLKNKLDKISKHIPTCNSTRECKKILKSLRSIKEKIDTLDTKQTLLKYYDDSIKSLNERYNWLLKRDNLRRTICNTSACVHYIKHHPSKNKDTNETLGEIQNSMETIMNDAKENGYIPEAALCKKIIITLSELITEA